MNFKNLFFIPTLLLSIAVFTTSCETEEPIPTPTAKVNFEITDAPIDDTNITGVFVTVNGLSINGEAATDFNGKETVNLLTLQNGNTKALGSSNLELGTYDRIALELDYSTDQDGNSPGCYVLTDDNVKHPLNSTSENALSLSGLSFDATEGATYVMDFDVRKAVKYSNDETDKYDFVTTSELEESIRVVQKSRTLSIKGNVESSLAGGGGYVVAYVYNKGDFNRDTEINGQGASNIQFKNAVTSAKVGDSGNYELSFLEAGEYELYFVEYEPAQEEDKMEASAFLEVSSLTSLNLLGLEVSAGIDLTVNVLVIGTNPI